MGINSDKAADTADANAHNLCAFRRRNERGDERERGGGDCVGLVVLSRCDLFHMKMRKANRKLAG